MGAVAKHRAGDVEQPIADRAEGTCVAVTAEAQSGVLGAAARIVLHGNACPVVESVLEPRITCEPSRDDAALSGTLGDRSSATKSPQGVIVSSLEGFPSSASSVARTIRPFPGREARIAASRCSFICPGLTSCM